MIFYLSKTLACKKVSYTCSKRILNCADHLQDIICAKTFLTIARNTRQWQLLDEDMHSCLIRWLASIASVNLKRDHRFGADDVTWRRVRRQRHVKIGHAHVVLSAVHGEQQSYHIFELGTWLVYCDTGNARWALVARLKIILQLHGHRDLERIYYILNVLLKWRLRLR